MLQIKTPRVHLQLVQMGARASVAPAQKLLEDFNRPKVTESHLIQYLRKQPAAGELTARDSYGWTALHWFVTFMALSQPM